MPINRTKTQQYLRKFDFRTLFIEELGWDNFSTPLPVVVEGTTYRLQGIAEKRGVAVFVLACSGEIPSYDLRRKIERQVAPRHREHLIIYSDGRTTQVWQWMRDEAGKPLASREHRYEVTQSGESLIQKLELLAIGIEEEERLNLPGVLNRVKSAFDVEKVTKKFYDQFKSQHTAFNKFLKGVPVGDLADWYVSVMLNRLMFVYFIQKKGFLAGDQNYLRNRLAASAAHGPDCFYRDFLCPLFFEGFATPLTARSQDTKRLLGDVPYLNGGIFARHQIEQAHGQDIQIPDKAFDKLFDFFEDYQWHLDDRPLRNDNEINPDVLGYIFEKYINQKQMGAYYTKEDITEYISKNTIVPYLLDTAGRSEPSFFQTDGAVWELLRVNPERYIYPAAAKGAEIPLPPKVAVGIEDVQQRSEWNKPAAGDYALPTEIWRETIARRLRYAEVRDRLAAGEVHSTSDLITYNLNIRRFAQDIVETCEDARLLRALWKAIRGISILDPTCGSGAFHFAALNILEPLYEGCLKRMAAFVAEDDQKTGGHARYEDFRKVLAEVGRHPNERYFITKSIIVDNLYGVDIMHEAVEIAKLRLFLKLVSLVDDASKIEPLPDIDFNIRAGNTLVGFATYAEMEQAVRGDRLLLLPEDEELLTGIDEQAADVDRLFARFRQMQTDYDPREFGDDYAATKRALQQRLEDLAGQLDRLLAQQYGVNPDGLEFSQWRESHQPFHWFAEFYGIIKHDGFDVIIGNPPYVEYSKIRSEYSVGKTYQTLACGNLYCFVTERTIMLGKNIGYLGLIVPISAFGTDRMLPLQQELISTCGHLWTSHFGIRPSKLFEGAEQRLTIIVGHLSDRSTNTFFAAKYRRWLSEERETLFRTLRYQPLETTSLRFGYPKIGSHLEADILRKLPPQKKLGLWFSETSRTCVYWHRIPGYFIKAIDFVPYFWSDRDGVKKSEDYKLFGLRAPTEAPTVLGILNSSTFYWYWFSISDGYHCGKHEVLDFPVDIDSIDFQVRAAMAAHVRALMESYQQNAERRTRSQRTTNVVYDEFRPSRSKAIIDLVDQALAMYYGFTPEEMDFIINYDIKYRMGDSLAGDGEDGDEE